MPLSFRKFTSTGQATYPIGFSYISPDHVEVLVAGQPWTQPYTLANGNITFTGTLPAAGAEVRIYRTTPGRTEASKNGIIVDFVNGSTLSESDLDAAVRQNFYLVQEAQDTAEGNLLSPGVIAEPMFSDGCVSTRALADGSVTEPKMADNAVSPRTIQANAITTTKILAENVTEPKLANNAVSERTIGAGQVTEGKIESTWRSSLAYRNADNTFTANNTFSSPPNVPLLPTQPAHATSKQYVDTGDSGYQGSTPGILDLPIGSVVLATYYFNQSEFVTYAESIQPNQTIKVWIHPHLFLPPNTNEWTNIQSTYVVTATGSASVPQAQSPTANYVQMSGTWKCRGYYNLSSGSTYFYLAQRIA